MDDESGWNAVLLELWSDEVRDAVVARIERVAVGRHGWLVRVFADPEGVREQLTEIVHAIVVAAIRDETGADLDELGSQAAWECYEQVWDGLAVRWADGGGLATVAIGREPSVVRAIASLPAEAAVAAGAELGPGGADPLWLRGRLRVDTRGLRSYLDLDGGRAPAAVHAAITGILAEVPDPDR
jgi:hypothetical protein